MCVHCSKQCVYKTVWMCVQKQNNMCPNKKHSYFNLLLGFFLITEEKALSPPHLPQTLPLSLPCWLVHCFVLGFKCCLLYVWWQNVEIRWTAVRWCDRKRSAWRVVNYLELLILSNLLNLSVMLKMDWFARRELWVIYHTLFHSFIYYYIYIYIHVLSSVWNNTVLVFALLQPTRYYYLCFHPNFYQRS